MRTDLLMFNTHSKTIGASKRAPAFAVAAALVLVLWFVTTGTPVNSSSYMSTTPAFVQPTHESSSSESSFGRGSSIDDAVTSGVDAHG
jgi:hypothetical protein